MNKASAEPKYLERIARLKRRVIETKPAMDLEPGKILTESFRTTEGQPAILRKAKAFREQCRQKSVTIWPDELIVGCSGSKTRGGILSVDNCWSILDKELDTINDRRYDPFELDEENRQIFTDIIKPYLQGRSNYEAWLELIP